MVYSLDPVYIHKKIILIHIHAENSLRAKLATRSHYTLLNPKQSATAGVDAYNIPNSCSSDDG